mmetsp:Transcript_103089/g.250392  ORF Transcript_103089/g.250392 Transcript_103089/m.250392 type:complete len:478 (-) Transcript_103089:128-1561(-)
MVHLQPPRLSCQRCSAILLLTLPGLLLRQAPDDGLEAANDCGDEAKPVQLVQVAWDLTVSPPVQGSHLQGEGWSLASVRSLLTAGGVPSLRDQRHGAKTAIIVVIIVVAVMVLLGCVMLAARSATAGAAAPPRTSPDPSEASAEEEEEEEDDIDLNEDIYSTVLQGLLRDGVAIIAGKSREANTMAMHKFRMYSVLVLLLTNYVLQYGVLIFIYSFVATPAVSTVQGIYSDFRGSCFTANGDFNSDMCRSFSQTEKLCGLVFTYTWFMMLILVIWSMAMVREFRDTERLGRILWNIQSTANFDEMIEFNHGVEHVTHLTPSFRLLIFVVVLLPKIGVTMVLGLLGTIWLAATDDLTDVILNAVALEFIIKIDELLFDAVVPATAKLELSNFKLTLMKRHKKGTFVTDAWKGYLASLAYLLLTVGLPPLYMTVGQRLPFVNVFPNFQRGEVAMVCNPYLEEHRARACVFGEVCFPYGR